MGLRSKRRCKRLRGVLLRCERFFRRHVRTRACVCFVCVRVCVCVCAWREDERRTVYGTWHSLLSRVPRRPCLHCIFARRCKEKRVALLFFTRRCAALPVQTEVRPYSRLFLLLAHVLGLVGTL